VVFSASGYVSCTKLGLHYLEHFVGNDHALLPMAIAMNKKRGALTPEVLVGLVLALLFLVIVVLVFKPVTSPKFFLGAKEQVCRSTIALSQAPVLDKLGFRPICSAQIIQFSEKDILKQAKKGEMAKDAAARQILEYMQRCKDIVFGPKKSAFLSGKSCYVCYSLHTDATTPYLSAEDLLSSSLQYREPGGLTYFASLRQDEHTILSYLPSGFGTTSPQGHSLVQGQLPLRLAKDYGVVYTVFEKGSLLKILGAGAGVCGVAVGATVGTWVIPVVGQLSQAVTLPVCFVSLGAAGATSLYELLQPKEEGVGALLLTTYNELDKYGCRDVIA